MEDEPKSNWTLALDLAIPNFAALFYLLLFTLYRYPGKVVSVVLARRTGESSPQIRSFMENLLP